MSSLSSNSRKGGHSRDGHDDHGKQRDEERTDHREAWLAHDQSREGRRDPVRKAAGRVVGNGNHGDSPWPSQSINRLGHDPGRRRRRQRRRGYKTEAAAVGLSVGAVRRALSFAGWLGWSFGGGSERLGCWWPSSGCLPSGRSTSPTMPRSPLPPPPSSGAGARLASAPQMLPLSTASRGSSTRRGRRNRCRSGRSSRWRAGSDSTRRGGTSCTTMTTWTGSSGRHILPFGPRTQL